MHIILGASGHVGSALAEALIANGEPVTVVFHDASKEAYWRGKGAHPEIADVHDVEALKKVFAKGESLFLLNPPAPPSLDTVAKEQRTVDAILAALKGSGIQKVVAESTYGAQPGKEIGDLGVLYQMEQQLAELPVQLTIIRAAYYMSNWDASLATALKDGVVHTLYPVDFALPMVAPADIGQVACGFMTAPVPDNRINYVEGPAWYSANDVAVAFSAALDKPVRAVSIARDQWIPALAKMGFSIPAARSMAAMTSITIDRQYSVPENPYRGSVTIENYIHDLVYVQK